MANDEHWEPDNRKLWNSAAGHLVPKWDEMHDDERLATDDFGDAVRDDGRAHYEPIVAELRARVEELETDRDSWRRVAERIEGEKRELTREFKSVCSANKESIGYVRELSVQLDALTAAESAQQKRIDDLESKLNQLKHDRDGWRDLYTVTAEEQAKRIAELDADALRIAEALGIVHEAEGHNVSADAQVREVKRLHERIAELESRASRFESRMLSVGDSSWELVKENDELTARIADREAQINAVAVSLGASVVGDTKETHLSRMVREARAKNEELKAQLARGVFVWDLSDEEIDEINASQSLRLPTDHGREFARACIDAATKLPDGAVRWSAKMHTDSDGRLDFWASDDASLAAERGALDVFPEKTEGTVHIVFVPEAKP